MQVEFFFDPRCPWTWLTSRWLLAAREVRPFSLRWRTFDLGHLHPDQEVPAGWAGRFAAGGAALAVIETLRTQDRHDDIERFYDAYGTHVHTQGNDPSVATVTKMVADLGWPEMAMAVDDANAVAAARASTDEALALVGGGTGSPVLAVTTDRRRAMFGPIVAPPPTGERAGQVWDAVTLLIDTPELAELKRNRGLEIALPPEVSR